MEFESASRYKSLTMFERLESETLTDDQYYMELKHTKDSPVLPSRTECWTIPNWLTSLYSRDCNMFSSIFKHPTVRKCEHWKQLHLILFLLFSNLIPVDSVMSSTSTVPVLSNFSTDQRHSFMNKTRGETYFHHMYFDTKNESQVYIGGLDFLYRLNTNDISSGPQSSENITLVSNYTSMIDATARVCNQPYSQPYKANPRYQCRNHIRGILPTAIDSELYICSTGAYSPQDFYLDIKTLTVTNVGYYSGDMVGAGSGITKCPYDPDTRHTVTYVEANHNTPYNYSTIYTSLLVRDNYEYNIYRSIVQADRFSLVRLNSLQNDPGPPLGQLSYIASFEIDRFMYFFFREIAVEYVNGKIHYSRIGRVCKNDQGGDIDPSKFLTYVKIRLNCSVVTNNEIPVYYNELYDVQYDSDSRIFFGLFMANTNGQWGSAVCQFSYADISKQLDNGDYYFQDQNFKLWTNVPDNQNPKPRNCGVFTKNMTIQAQSFSMSHMLITGTIDQTTNVPLYYTTDSESYNRIAVDVVQISDKNYTVLNLYSAAAPEDITRVVSWKDSNENIQSRKFSVLKPFTNLSASGTTWDMKIHSVAGVKWLYLVNDDAVVQLALQQCNQYTMCTDCAKDPYCGWNATRSVCSNFSNGLIQGVNSSSVLSVCNHACLKSNYNISALPGLSVHLKYSSYCEPEDGSVTWLHEGTNLTSVDSDNFVSTGDNGLIILNVTRSLVGTIQCTSNGVVLAEYSLAMSGCTYTPDIQQTWMMEYKNWCYAFDDYKKDYAVWQKQCVGTKN